MPDFIARKADYEKSKHYQLLQQINPAYGLDILIKEIKADNWTLYNVQVDETIVGIFICRLDEIVDKSNELVIMHAVSALKQNIPFFVVIEPLIDGIAKQAKVNRIRVHSDNEGINKMILKHTDYKVFETVFVKAVK